MLTLRKKKATTKAKGLHLTAEAPKCLHGRLGPDDQPNVAILRALVALRPTAAKGHCHHVENAAELHLEDKSEEHKDQSKAGR